MASILLHSKSGLVGRSDDVSIEFTQESRFQIDGTSMDSHDGFREFVAGVNHAKATIVAKDMTFSDSFMNGVRTELIMSDENLHCRIFEGGRQIARADVIIEDVSVDEHSMGPRTRMIQNVKFRIMGMIDYQGMQGAQVDWVTIDDPMPIPIELIKGGFKIIP